MCQVRTRTAALSWRFTIVIHLIVIVSFFVLAVTAYAQEPPMRVSLVRGNLAQADQDPVTGELRGVAIHVAKELTSRLGRELNISMASPTAIIDGVAKGEIDLGFVAPNPDRLGTVMFSQNYMLVQQTAIVTSSSSITSVRNLGLPTHTIGANVGDSVAGYLKRNYREATIVESTDTTMGEALSWLETGHVVAFAGNRQRLGTIIQDKPSFRLLTDNIYSLPHAIAVSMERKELLNAINRELAEMRTSGFIERSVTESGTVGIVVAPAP